MSHRLVLQSGEVIKEIVLLLLHHVNVVPNMPFGRSTDSITSHDAKCGLTRLDKSPDHAGNSRQAPKQSYLSRASSSAGLRGSMPSMRASMMKGGKVPKAPAEIPLGISQRV